MPIRLSLFLFLAHTHILSLANVNAYQHWPTNPRTNDRAVGSSNCSARARGLCANNNTRPPTQTATATKPFRGSLPVYSSRLASVRVPENDTSSTEPLRPLSLTAPSRARAQHRERLRNADYNYASVQRSPPPLFFFSLNQSSLPSPPPSFPSFARVNYDPYFGSWGKDPGQLSGALEVR